MVRQHLNILQLLARRRSHRHPYSCELGKQAYNEACKGNWWISSTLHVSFIRVDYHTQINATNFERWGVKKLSFNFPPQPVIVLDNSPYHCLQVDRPLSTCIVKTGMIWLSKKGIGSYETMSKSDLLFILPQKPKEISTKLIVYWLIMVVQFDCLHACDLNL